MNARLRSLISVAWVLLLTASCATLDPAARTTDGPRPTSAHVQALPSATPASPASQPADPIDTTLTPVSRSNPGPEAQAAIEACNLDPARITGMAKLSDAGDLPKYVRLTGQEPELREHRPVWVITYSGRFTIRTIWAEDPTCVVLDGEPTLFLTGDYGRGDSVEHPLPVPDPPLSLPPLAP